MRIELWGDEVDSIRSFDVESQRSIENLESVLLYPAAELIPDQKDRRRALERIEKEAGKAEAFSKKKGRERSFPESGSDGEYPGRAGRVFVPLSAEGLIDYFTEKKESFLDCFPTEKTLLFLDEPNRILESAQAVELEFRESMEHRLEKGYVLPGQTKLLFSSQEAAARMCAGRAVGLCTLENARSPWMVTGKYSLTVRSVNPYNNSFEYLVHDLKRWKKEGYR